MEESFAKEPDFSHLNRSGRELTQNHRILTPNLQSESSISQKHPIEGGIWVEIHQKYLTGNQRLRMKIEKISKKFSKGIDLRGSGRVAFARRHDAGGARDRESIAVRNYRIGFLVPSTQLFDRMAQQTTCQIRRVC